MPVSELQHHGIYFNGNVAGVWRAIATGLGGMVIGLLLAWWTAYQGKGVNPKELAEYVRDYSPYVFDKPTLIEHNRIQDEEIGKLEGRQNRAIDRLNEWDKKEGLDDRERAEIKTKLDAVSNLLIELQKKK